MHNYKMVFIDLDGTTLTTDKRITPRTRKIIEKQMTNMTMNDNQLKEMAKKMGYNVNQKHAKTNGKIML